LKSLPGADQMPLVFPIADLKPYHADILRALGLPNPILPLRTRLTRFERLVFPTFLDPSTVTPRQIAWLRDVMFRAFPAAAKRDGPRRILVSRRDAMARRLSNEAALAARLEALGFVCVTPGALPVAEQIRLFASADIVVAPHGAGNVNMAFCPPGAAFLELVPAGNASSLYWMMANVCDLRYGREVCFEDVPGESMIADPDKTVSLVEAALADR
jgi:capsular polysaccharide biosynthesis protein